MDFENQYVTQTYNQIARHFDSTRYGVWPGVSQFIESLATESRVVDVGCGNGKNMLHRKDLQMRGCDSSEEMVRICQEKGLDVTVANNIDLPYNDNQFDAALSVAVIHHLSTSKRRSQALGELVRIVRPGGRVFVQVWATGQKLAKGKDQQIGERDSLVSWNLKDSAQVYKRFYHFYEEGELERELSGIPDIQIVRSFYESGNWGVEIQKITRSL